MLAAAGVTSTWSNGPGRMFTVEAFDRPPAFMACKLSVPDWIPAMYTIFSPRGVRGRTEPRSAWLDQTNVCPPAWLSYTAYPAAWNRAARPTDTSVEAVF